MVRVEYLRIHSKYFSPAFCNEYNLHHKIHVDGYVYCQIKKGMYGLKQAAILAYKLLVKRLAQDGYQPIPLTNGLFRHCTRKTVFPLCVDNFGITYNSAQDLQHLITTLKKHYNISLYYSGSDNCGLKLCWNYKAGYVDISMPDYVQKALWKYNHPTPSRPQYAPFRWTQPAYGQKIQYAQEHQTANELLDEKGKRRMQSVVGTFLYYSRAVNPTVLIALNDLATYQAAPTIDTLKHSKMLLDYLATYPNAKLRFYAGNMKLHFESDAAYLVLPGAKSRIAGYFYLHAPLSASKVYAKG